MDRRFFIAGLGGAALAWPGPGGTQQRVARVGTLDPVGSAMHQAFIDGMRDLGYVEGRNLVLESLSAEGHNDRLPALAAQLVSDKMDVIFGEGSQATRVLLAQTKTIPIVMASADPIGDGFVSSLARPEGNVTGVSLFGPEPTGKRLELLREFVPGLARIAVFWNPEDPSGSPGLKAVETAAAALSLQTQAIATPDDKSFEGAFKAATDGKCQALTVVGSPVMTRNAAKIAELALAARLPTVLNNRLNAEAGGLLSYGPNLDAAWRRAAYYVDRILKGAKPADLPVEQPTTFSLVVNAKTAKALGLTIPPSVLMLADEVIE